MVSGKTWVKTSTKRLAVILSTTNKKHGLCQFTDKSNRNLIMNKKTIPSLATLIILPSLFLATSVNAVGMGDRVDNRQERRGDAVDNTAQGIDDRQDFREGRRDCVGDGADCRQDNREEKRDDRGGRANDRQGDRQDRVQKRF